MTLDAKSMVNSPPPLSEREAEILKLVATGQTNQQIANALNISVNTVKVHLRNIFGKIGTASRTEASMYAVRTGLVDVARAQPIVEDDVVPLSNSVDEAMRGEATLLSNGTAQSMNDVVAVSPLPVEPLLLAEQPVMTTFLPTVTPTRSPQTRLLAMGGTIVAGLILVGLLAWLVAGKNIGLGTGATGNPTSISPSNGVFVTQLTQQWMPKKSPPLAQCGAAAASLDGKMFVVGGQMQGKTSGSLLRYDPNSDSWAQLKTKPTPVSDVQAVVYAGKIYVPGGKDADGKITNKLEIYDPSRDTWITAQTLPAPRSAYGLAAFEGRIYLFGGWDGTEAHAEAYVYDPSNDRWSALPPMQTARAYPSGVVAGENLYVIGGENSSGPLTANEAFVPATQRWELRTPLPKARTRASAGVLTPNIYLLGGTDESRPLYYNYSNPASSWQEVFVPPTTPISAQPAVALLYNSLFMLGCDKDQTASRSLMLNQIQQAAFPLGQ